MSIRTALTERFGLTYPIIQAPMAGGASTPELIAAVGNAGGLGFVGAAYSTPEQITEIGRAIRSLTARPFGINLFAPLPVPPPPKDADAILERVAPFSANWGYLHQRFPPRRA